MLNKIWFGLLCIGILYGFCKATYRSFYPPVVAATDAGVTSSAPLTASAGNQAKSNDPPLLAMGKRLNDAAFDAAQSAVTICIGLIGIMVLWLGLLNIAKDAGLLEAFARLLRPLMRWLFPEVPDGHPAQGAMLMNIAANMLGLDNAATPMGLKAMTELQTLNPVKERATNSMVMFLAINNSSVTLIPFTLIGYRALKGSQSPAEPLGGIVIVTTFSTVVAVLVAKWLAQRTKYRVPIEMPVSASQENGAGGNDDG
jgi:spore maturation protein A